jgi:hypothetical protein
VDRILLISGDVITREDTLKRRVLRFTGSRRATRTIMARIDAARRLGQVMTCMIVPPGSKDAGSDSWEVRVSYAAPAAYAERAARPA